MTNSDEASICEVEFGTQISKLVVAISDDESVSEADRLSLFTTNCDSYVVLTTGKTGKPNMAIEREADELTKADLITHRVDVEKAMFKELANWMELGALKQRGRQGCTYLMDSRWIIRWKKQSDG